MLPKSPAWLSFWAQAVIIWTQKNCRMVWYGMAWYYCRNIWEGWRKVNSTSSTMLHLKYLCLPIIWFCSYFDHILIIFWSYFDHTASGLKCPPAATQLLLVSPTAWTWMPCKPGLSPNTLPWILTWPDHFKCKCERGQTTFNRLNESVRKKHLARPLNGSVRKKLWIL